MAANPKGGYVYIVSNLLRTVLYTGVTSNLQERSEKHRPPASVISKEALVASFSKLVS